MIFQVRQINFKTRNNLIIQLTISSSFVNGIKVSMMKLCKPYGNRTDLDPLSKSSTYPQINYLTTRNTSIITLLKPPALQLSCLR
jgi:hypothetical protein